jgi:hypothetical protein
MVELRKWPKRMRGPIAIISMTLAVAVFARLDPAGAVYAAPLKEAEGGPQEEQVREFVAAFNARDLDKMIDAVDDGIQWLSVDGVKVTVVTEGKKALRESMERYFRECPSCKSALEWTQVAGSRVSAMERASWTAKGAAKSQSGLSVYEFRGGKILRVYYFPAEAGPK